MHKITLLCVGSLKSSWAAEGCAQYTERLRSAMDLEIVELAASKEKDPERQLKEESAKILDAIAKRSGRVWVLDETGKSFTSSAYSDALIALRNEGQPLIFVIGGAYGLSDDVRTKADTMLRLSDMTLPHELCRVFFLEQLYRAMQIEKGAGRRQGYGRQGGYHH